MRKFSWFILGFSVSFLAFCSETNAAWVQQTGAGSHIWSDLQFGSDGTHAIASAYGDYVHFTANDGATWNPETSLGIGNWQRVCASDDFTIRYAADYNGYLWVSVNSGGSWAHVGASGLGTNPWRSLSCSSDGTVVAVVSDSSHSYVSRDTGNTFSLLSNANYQNEIKLSSNGNVAVLNSGTPTKTDWISYVSGSWTPGNSIGCGDGSLAYNCYSVGISSTASKALNAASTGYPRLTLDGGATYSGITVIGTSYDQRDIGMSGDGSRILTASYSAGNSYISLDSGDNWSTAYNPGGALGTAAVSRDGSMVGLSQASGYLYFNRLNAPTPLPPTTGARSSEFYSGAINCGSSTQTVYDTGAISTIWNPSFTNIATNTNTGYVSYPLLPSVSFTDRYYSALNGSGELTSTVVFYKNSSGMKFGTGSFQTNPETSNSPDQSIYRLGDELFRPTIPYNPGTMGSLTIQSMDDNGNDKLVNEAAMRMDGAGNTLTFSGVASGIIGQVEFVNTSVPIRDVVPLIYTGGIARAISQFKQGIGANIVRFLPLGTGLRFNSVGLGYSTKTGEFVSCSNQDFSCQWQTKVDPNQPTCVSLGKDGISIGGECGVASDGSCQPKKALGSNYDNSATVYDGSGNVVTDQTKVGQTAASDGTFDCDQNGDGDVSIGEGLTCPWFIGKKMSGQFDSVGSGIKKSAGVISGVASGSTNSGAIFPKVECVGNSLTCNISNDIRTKWSNNENFGKRIFNFAMSLLAFLVFLVIAYLTFKKK